MSTPSGENGNPWTQPGDPADPTRPVPAPSPSTYGTPSSPSYGKYGQGMAVPPPAPTQPMPGQPAQYGQPGQYGRPEGWGQPAPGQPGWGQPGYVPPAQQWRPAGPATFQRIAGGLTTAVLVLSALMGLALCLVAYLAPNQNQAIKDVLDGISTGATTRAATAEGSAAYQVLSPLALLVEVLVWVLTCLWLTKVRNNALALNPGGQRRSEVWIWLGWIIPVVNLWFPKQIVDDAIRSTAPAAGVPPLRTGLWWTAWLASLVLGIVQGVANFLPPNDSLKLVLVVIEVVVIAVALILWFRIVRWLSTKQDALAAGQAPGAPTLQG